MCACACKRIEDERLVRIVKILIEKGANYHFTDK